MQKWTTLLLITAIGACVLTACSSKPTEPHQISDYDTVSAVTPEDEQVNGEITVKDKKYVYEGTEIVILDVKNNTDKDLVLTIDGSYLDKDGNVLQTETKTFAQFYAGYQNYFLFDPKINFDSFTYTVTSEITGEDCFIKNVVVYISEPTEGRDSVDGTFRPALVGGIGASNGNPFTISLDAKIILFNEQGDIVCIKRKVDPYTTNPTHPEITSAYEEWNGFFVYTDTEHSVGNLELPEHLKGKLTSIVCVQNIEKTM